MNRQKHPYVPINSFFAAAMLWRRYCTWFNVFYIKSFQYKNIEVYKPVKYIISSGVFAAAVFVIPGCEKARDNND